MKRFSVIVWMVGLALILAACRGSATPTPTPTPVVEPTATPVPPTPTPIPPTPTPVPPTPTPVPTATFTPTPPPVPTPTPTLERTDLFGTAFRDERLTTFVLTMRAAGLVDTLKNDGPYTIFAPSDEAFGKIPGRMIGELLEDTPRLKKILLYHMVQGRVLASELAAIDSVQTVTLKTVLGEPVTLTIENGKVLKINNALIRDTDIEATNGVIHIIDTVLMPTGERGVRKADAMPKNKRPSPTPTPTVTVEATPTPTATAAVETESVSTPTPTPESTATPTRASE